MLAALLLAISSSLLAGIFAAVVFGALIFYLFLSACGVSPSLAQLVVGVCMCAAPIMSVGLLARWLSGYCFERQPLRSFEVISQALAFFMMVNSRHLELYLGAVSKLSQQPDYTALSLAFLSVLNSAVFCAGVGAACYILCLLSLELPFAWFTRRHHFAMPIRSLRPLGVLIMLSLSLHLLIGLYAAEFSARIIGK